MRKTIPALALVILIAIGSSVALAQEVTCNTCHSPTVQAMAGGNHSGVSCITCHLGAEEHAANPTQIQPDIDVRAETCGQCHQLIYDDYRYVNRVDQTPQKMEEYPLLPKLLSGHAFAKDYREPREHFNMLEDIELTTRGKNAACYTCKSADVYHQWNKPGGINFDSDVEELLTSGKISNPITCVMCHDPHRTETRVVSFALKEALDRMPNDHPAQEDDINTLVCAQCHVNYNFNVPEKTIEFPFRKLADMPDYIENNEFWQQHPTGGWKHPELDMYLYKVQHPEVELYWESAHHRAGVTCVGCHMPKTTAQDGTVFTQHFLGSPLNNPDETCGSCHNQSEEWYREQIKNVQDQAYALMSKAMDEMVIAIESIEEARTTDNVNQNLLGQARDAYFLSHLSWEWIASENSMGWHHPQEATAALQIANQKAQEAQVLAQRALTEPVETGVDTATPGDRRTWLWVIVGLALAAAAYFFLNKRNKV